MGRIRHEPSGRTFDLVQVTTVGRSSTCELQLAAPRMSKQHASLWWSQGGWLVRDLGSKNGTFVDGRRLKVGEVVQLRVGTALRFAPEEPPWQVVDTAPPAATTHGGLDTTQDIGAVEPDVALDFRVSSDEEVVRITVHIPGLDPVVLDPRVYHYMLLTLARAHLDDRQRGVAPELQGWLAADELARMLRVKERTLNVHVHRAREQLQQAGVPGELDVLERHGRLGKLRLGVSDLHVANLTP